MERLKETLAVCLVLSPCLLPVWVMEAMDKEQATRESCDVVVAWRSHGVLKKFGVAEGITGIKKHPNGLNLDRKTGIYYFMDKCSGERIEIPRSETLYKYPKTGSRPENSKKDCARDLAAVEAAARALVEEENDCDLITESRGPKRRSDDSTLPSITTIPVGIKIGSGLYINP